MKGRGKYGPYLAAGVTAFAVIAAAILLFFLLEHFSAIRSLLETIGYILRPICYGIVLAFLLLPVHRRILAVLTDQCQGILDPCGKKKNILSAISILLSLIFAFLVLYVLLAMVLPQLYWSLVGLFEALPGYFQSVQQWLTTFLADNPDIQQAVLSYYRTAGAALNQWLSSDLIPNLESASSTLAWLRSELLPQLTGVVSGVSTVVLALVNLLKDIIVAVIVSVYLLARKDVFAAQSKKILYSMFPTRAADLLVEESRSAYRILSGFINGTLVDSFIVGVICLICFTVFQFPYPMLLAVIIGVTNVIPFFGPFIGAIPSGLLILLVSPRQCLYFVIFIFVLQQLDGWVEIELDETDGEGTDHAYISTRDNNVEVRYALPEAIKFSPLEEAAQAAASLRTQVVNYALQFVGNPYVWGGTSLTNGVDCSGFTMQVMKHFGVSLPHYSGSQAKMGKSVSSSEMRPGDLVFYANSGGTVNHVAMYIGNGQVVHAASSRSGIKISSWNYRTPKTIRNVLGD